MYSTLMSPTYVVSTSLTPARYSFPHSDWPINALDPALSLFYFILIPRFTRLSQ